jgi:hypothetical protein
VLRPSLGHHRLVAEQALAFFDDRSLAGLVDGAAVAGRLLDESVSSVMPPQSSSTSQVARGLPVPSPAAFGVVRARPIEVSASEEGTYDALGIAAGAGREMGLAKVALWRPFDPGGMAPTRG